MLLDESDDDGDEAAEAARQVQFDDEDLESATRRQSVLSHSAQPEALPPPQSSRGAQQQSRQLPSVVSGRPPTTNFNMMISGAPLAATTSTHQIEQRQTSNNPIRKAVKPSMLKKSSKKIKRSKPRSLIAAQTSKSISQSQTQRPAVS